MFDYSPQPTRKEYREIKKNVPDLTWENYLKQKEWEKRNYNPKAEKAFSALLDIMGNHEFFGEPCHKCNTSRIRVQGDKGLFWLCTYCGYMCKVDGNRYIYILLISDIPPADLRYNVDNRGNVSLE